ncbi:hypothetical protein [Streptomyces mobaraensis]|uniref:Uncharacterized protein n=1 Tax=Streptomyces mobaraensis TaxID=35621 RepID=A0A5N5W2K6_STRMB|nr:hypothetical protein [Streptomyces mobaraensis]KAB7835488.1 hypothetical protein FRZ00_26690 [Streptomyces mobaraensis]
MAHDLVAVCDVCLGEIDDGDGVLEADMTAADRTLRAWRRRVGADPLAVFHTSRGAQPVRWTTRHHDCDGGRPTHPYTIPVERVRSWPALLQWGVHLADKHFTAATDWHDLVERAVEPRRAAVSGILPRHPRDLNGGPIGDRPPSSPRRD